MIKITEFFKRRQGMSRVAFIEHWQTAHTHVVMGIENLRFYVQNPVLQTDSLPATWFDGMVEVWFDDVEALRTNARSDYWPEVIADEKRFIDRDSLRVVMSESDGHHLAESGYKLIALLEKPADCDVKEFQTLVQKCLSTQPNASGCDFPMSYWYEREANLLADALVSMRVKTYAELTAAIESKAFDFLRDEFIVSAQFSVEERLIK
ncbi:MAG: EthD domain-containing protein [Pseudomonadota bacterium]